MNLLLNPKSKAKYDQILEHTPHCLLLIASVGCGKETLLKELANNKLKDKKAGNFIEILPEDDKTSIGIDQVRQIKSNLKLKSLDHRIIMINNAQFLTIEAQNSLLKILEEPPKNVHFFLSSDNINSILETIQSRSAIWRLVMPQIDQIKEYYKDNREIDKLISICGNRIGLIGTIINSENSHPLLDAIELSKEILAESRFDRLTRVDALSKDHPQTKILLEALEITCKAALEYSVSKRSDSAKQWNNRLKAVMKAQNLLRDNVLPKLVIARLFMVL
jgi:hypothetical protein